MTYLRSKRIISTISAAISVTLFYFFSGLYHYGPKAFTQPWTSGGDDTLFLSLITTLRRGDWSPFLGIQSTHMGAPYGTNLADFPFLDQAHFLILKMISWFTSNPYSIYNFYYCLGFVLASVTMTLCLRKLKIEPYLALGLGWIYAFLPFHWMRYSHLFLAGYFALPWSVLWLFKLSGSHQGRLKLWPTLLFGVIFGSLGVYYSFFFCFFAVSLGIIVAVREEQWKRLERPFQVVAAVLLGCSINLLPSLIYWTRYGRDKEIAKRFPWEAHLHSLRLGNVFFPFEGHRLGFIANRLRERYNTSLPPVEGLEEYWGVLTIVGICLLLFLTYRKSARYNYLARLRTLVISGLLLGLTGGFGVIFNVLVSPQIRCYNRISVYLATFGIISLGIFAQHCLRLLKRKGLPSWIAFTVISIALCLGLMDQVGQGWQIVPKTTDADSDHAFIQAIETTYPRNQIMLQLPFVAFPESPAHLKMEDYAHLRVLLYANHTSISYGAPKGRTAAREIERISLFPFIPAAAQNAAYDGVYIDRFGFPDNGAYLIAQLRQQLHQEPLESPNKRLAYFSLR